MIYVEDVDFLVTSSSSDIYVWSVDKGIMLFAVKFANKWNYILY